MSDKKSETKDVFAEIKVKYPADVKVSLTVTMSMADWVRLQEHFPTRQEYPFPKFRHAIQSVIYKAKNRWEYDSRTDFSQLKNEGEDK
jgi:hypothetical protein